MIPKNGLRKMEIPLSLILEIINRETACFGGLQPIVADTQTRVGGATRAEKI